MFDIGFWELAVIGVVALLVVGPERLPGLARTIGLWVGRIRRYVATVKDDIEREVRADELKQMLAKTNDLNPLQDIVDETENTISTAKKELADVEKNAQQLTADESLDVPSSADFSRREVDETGVDPVTPDSAATAIGEHLSARSDAQDRVETPNADAESTEDDERRTS